MKFAKQAGAKVTAMDPNEDRLRLCKTWVPADYNTVNVKDDPLQALKRITEGDFPAVVFDATGNAKSMEQALDTSPTADACFTKGWSKPILRFTTRTSTNARWRF